MIRLGILFTLILTGITGCTGYSPLEQSGEPTSVELLPVINQSELPQIIAPLARNVREKLAHSANWRLAGNATAAAQLRITVLSVEREDIARDPQDTGRPLSFHETVRVSIEWLSELPPPWGDSPVTEIESDQLIYAQPSLVDAESVAMAELADRLAEKVLQQLDWTSQSR